MSDNFFRVNKGITLNPSDIPTSPQEGQIYLDQNDNKTKINGPIQTIDPITSTSVEISPTPTIDPLSGFIYTNISTSTDGIVYKANPTSFAPAHLFNVHGSPIMSVQYGAVELLPPDGNGSTFIRFSYNFGSYGNIDLIPEYTAVPTYSTLQLPSSVVGIDTLVARTTTDTFENKTFDTAATGNVLKVNGTQLTNVTGTGSVVLDTSPTLTTPSLGTPTSIDLTNGTNLPISTGVSGLGTNIATFLATPTSANLSAAISDETGSGALVFANTPTLISPILGTPTSGTLTNCTGLPINGGVSGLGTGIVTFLETPTSANLAAAITNETGTAGSLVFSNSPTLVTPNIGSATATSVTGPTSANLILDSLSGYNVELKNQNNTTATISSTGLDLASGKYITLTDNTKTVSIKPNSSTSASYDIVLPAAAPASTQVMQYNGTNFVWVNGSITVNGTSIGLGNSDTITANTTNALTAGTGLQLDSGTTFNGSSAKTISINSSVVTLTGTQSLTNKTIGDSLTFAQISTPSNPSSGFNKLYVKSDGSFYSLNSSGVEKAVGGGWTISNSTSLTAGGTVSINLVGILQAFRVAGSSTGITTLSTTPFGASAPSDGICIRLIGTNDANPIKITNNDISKGCLLNGDCALYKGNVIELQYSLTDDRYYEISRNF